MTYEQFLLALCIYREARGCDNVSRLGVKHVVLNRAARPGSGGIAGVILAPHQFSSFSGGDPNAVKFPLHREQAWLDCCALALTDEADPTNGATHYHSAMAQPPAWADPAKRTAIIGPFSFYRLTY